MLQRNEGGGEVLRGVQMCKRAPRVSHLLFADDCIVFYKAWMEEGLKVTKILEDYERESGQKLNKDKTSLFFSKNGTEEVKEAMKEMFGAQIIH